MNRSVGLIVIAAVAVVTFAGCGGGGGGGSVSPSIPGRTYGGAGNDYAWSVQQTSDGGYIFAGFTDSQGAGGYDAWVVKTDASGNVLREKTFGYSGHDYAFSIQQTSDGGYIVTGVDNEISGNLPNSAFWLPPDFSGELTLRKLNADLTLAWETVVGTVSSGGSSYPNSMGYAVQQTADGGYIVVGATGTSPAGGGQTLYLPETRMLRKQPLAGRFHGITPSAVLAATSAFRSSRHRTTVISLPVRDRAAVPTTGSTSIWPR